LISFSGDLVAAGLDFERQMNIRCRYDSQEFRSNQAQRRLSTAGESENSLQMTAGQSRAPAHLRIAQIRATTGPLPAVEPRPRSKEIQGRRCGSLTGREAEDLDESHKFSFSQLGCRVRSRTADGNSLPDGQSRIPPRSKAGGADAASSGFDLPAKRKLVKPARLARLHIAQICNGRAASCQSPVSPLLAGNWLYRRKARPPNCEGGRAEHRWFLSALSRKRAFRL